MSVPSPDVKLSPFQSSIHLTEPNQLKLTYSFLPGHTYLSLLLLIDVHEESTLANL